MAQQQAYQDYYAQHGIWGAYASFVVGKQQCGGGFVLGDVTPPKNNIYLGYQDSEELPVLFPWVSEVNPTDGSTAYTAKKAQEEAVVYRLLPQAEIQRNVLLGSDSYTYKRLTARFFSFFGSIPDPEHHNQGELKDALCPVLLLQLHFNNEDNAHELTGFFGMRGVMRVLSDSTDGRLLGVANTNKYGFATLAQESVSEVLDWNAPLAAFSGPSPLKRLSEEGGLLFSVPAHTKRTYTIALGVFDGGVVTALISMQRYYTSLFQNLEDVLEYGLMIQTNRIVKAEAMDALLEKSTLSSERKLLLANAAHSYNASTELLLDNSGRPIFLVNEGEYRMMNTLDLVVDQAYWELAFSSWTVRNELEFFLERSCYEDEWGLAFCHDQGVADCFSAHGYSVYEMPNLVDCFSYMSYEETLNWTLTSCLYCYNTGDLQWAKKHRPTFEAILDSLMARDQNGDGVMDVDSSRCEQGSEITTYDSLDVSLGQARNNLYLAVKAWGTFICLSSLFTSMGRLMQSKQAQSMAQRIKETVSSYFLVDQRYIPAVFESGNRSMIIPAIEGLIYPYLCGCPTEVSATGENAAFIALLKEHLSTSLVPGRCLDEHSGGWKLSSTSKNTWLSKIFLNQFVASKILGVPEELVARDATHCKWLFDGSSVYGMTDQVDSSSGRDLGSRLYPRLVTAILWLLNDHGFVHLSLPLQDGE